MTLEIIQYDGTKTQIYAKDFEIRSNQVSNWIKVTYAMTDEQVYIHNFCKIKLLDK